MSKKNKYFNTIKLISLFILCATLIVAIWLYYYLLERDNIICTVEDIVIHETEIDNVYNKAYGHLDISESEKNKIKSQILENGINEIIAIWEAEKIGFSIDIPNTEMSLENLKNESPDIYSLIEKQVDYETYIQDLAKSNLINDLKKHILTTYELPIISDEELYDWYCDQIDKLGKKYSVPYEVFLENKKSIYANWKQLCESEYYIDWLMNKRGNYIIKYFP